MSQIEGQEVEEQPVPGQQVAEEPEYVSDDEKLFAEEFERRVREERGEDEPAPAPAVEPEPEPAPDTVVETAPLPQTDGAATPAPAEPAVEKPEWYEGLSDEAKLAYDGQQDTIQQLQWQYSAVHGRLAPVQAENERLRRLATQPKVAPTQGGQPAPSASTPTPDFETQEFKEFAENYPDEAAQMKLLWASQQANTQRLETRLESLAQGLDQVQSFSTNQQMASELQNLEARHPDWMLVRNSPEFDSWLQSQPSAVQPLVNSKNADECSYLLDRYKQDVYLYQLQQQTGGEAPASPQQERATQTAAHRQTLIQTPTPNPQGGGVGVPGGQRPPQSDEEMWVEELERRVRAQKQMRN